MTVARLISWLAEPRPEGPMPAIDRCATALYRLCYLATRLALRLTLGKERRDRVLLAKSFRLKNYSPSFHMMKWLYRSFGIGKSADGSHVMKICVPKHGYEYFCRVEKGDFTPDREEDVLGLFTPTEGDVVVDAGAHIGRYTILGSKRVGPGGKVIAIEAEPDNFQMLNRNIRLNRLTNVVPLNCAAYSSETKLKLYEPSSDVSIYNTVMPSRSGRDSEYVEVQARTLDSVLGSVGISNVNWIKIDVEGAELEVLKGAVSTLSASARMSVLVEVHDIQQSDHYNNVADFLSLLGFKAEFEIMYDSGRERHVLFRK